MKKWLPGCCLLLCMAAAAQKKEFTLGRLLQLTQTPQTELTEKLARQDFFAQSSTEQHTTFSKRAKKAGLPKSLSISRSPDKVTLVFNTCVAEEFEALTTELKASFRSDNISNAASCLYQKGSFCVKPFVQKEGLYTNHQLTIEHKLLPQAADIRFVEDLLQLPSHEYLAATFGDNSVKKDRFYFSETEVSKCSVLFPHTARQVIVIWADEAHNREPALLVVGGSAEGLNAQAANYKTAAISAWPSVTGIYPGMTLKELEQLNGGAVQFYGWDTEEPGVALQAQKGAVNFKKFGVQLQCLDCNEDSYYSNTGIISSDVLLRQNRRAYVMTMVVKPEMKK